MADDEENYEIYGTLLEPYDEDTIPKKKAFSVEDQIATDEQGRRRFHGAFTGGFSAGFFNTVGSLEGWKPSEFKSSRLEKAEKKLQQPHDFMDDEDIGQFGIAPSVVRATSDYSSSETSKRKRAFNTQGSIPGIPVLQTLEPAKETVGIRLLRKMGWKPGQGVGPRLTKSQKKKMREEHKKVYGCEVPEEFRRKEHRRTESDGSSSEEEFRDSEDAVTFAPDDFEVLVRQAKDNTFGMGYKGLDKQFLLFDPKGFKVPRLKMQDHKNQRISISGQAFGVGAFEKEDEDIYATDDMSRYDFELGSSSSLKSSNSLSSKSSRKDFLSSNKNSTSCHKKSGETSEGKEGKILEGFVEAQQPPSAKKAFPPPLLPKNFVPKHGIRLSRFEPLPPTHKMYNYDRQKVMGRHDLSSSDRSRIINFTGEISREPFENSGPISESETQSDLDSVSKGESSSSVQKIYNYIQKKAEGSHDLSSSDRSRIIEDSKEISREPFKILDTKHSSGSQSEIGSLSRVESSSTIEKTYDCEQKNTLDQSRIIKDFVEINREPFKPSVPIYSLETQSEVGINVEESQSKVPLKPDSSADNNSKGTSESPSTLSLRPDSSLADKNSKSAAENLSILSLKSNNFSGDNNSKRLSERFDSFSSEKSTSDNHSSAFNPPNLDQRENVEESALKNSKTSSENRLSVFNSSEVDESRKVQQNALKITADLPKTPESSVGIFKPFLANPDKQNRYEQYLTLQKLGQKHLFSDIQPASMTHWEKEREQEEFAQAARMFKPVSGLVFDKFVSASNSDESVVNSVEIEGQSKSSSIYQHGSEELREAAKKKKFGHLTRTIEVWKPHKLLCRRFNVPDPDISEAELQISRKKSKFSVFDYYEAYQQNKPIKEGPEPKKDIIISTHKQIQEENITSPKKPAELSKLDESRSENLPLESKTDQKQQLTDPDPKSPSDSIKKSVIPSQTSEKVTSEKYTKSALETVFETTSNKDATSVFKNVAEKSIKGQSIQINISQTSLPTTDLKNNEIRRPKLSLPDPKIVTIPTDPKKKLDLFRAIFLSSDSEEEPDQDREDSKNQEEKITEMKKILLEEEQPKTVKESRKPKGIFSDLDWSKVNKPKISAPVTTPEKSVDEEKKLKQEEEIEVDVYGPKLPAKSASDSKHELSKMEERSSSEDDEWVEMDSKGEKKSGKKNKKHKHSKSKHKKHKSKHKKKKR